MPIDPLTDFAKAQDGAVAIIVSLMLTVLIGFVALGVDVASLYRDRAHLQAVVDLTAVSAMGNRDNAHMRAQHTVARTQVLLTRSRPSRPGGICEIRRLRRKTALPRCPKGTRR